MKSVRRIKNQFLKTNLADVLFDCNVQKLELSYVRDKMNFIEQFLDYTRELESPTSFFQWSAISALSAVMRDNVYIHWGQLQIYPNLYVMLLADSGICRKSQPLKKVLDLISAVDNTKIIMGRSSIQGVVAELARTESDGKGFIPKRDACGLLYAEEFAASLVNDPAVIHILTDLYDYRKTYPVILRDSVVTLKNVCFGMLVATNSKMLQQLYDQVANEGGLIGRTIVIHETKRRHKNSMVFSEKKSEENKKPLIAHLKALSKFRGEIETEMDAKIYYDEWYTALDDDVVDKTGFIYRIQTTVAKVAMILAAAEPCVLTEGRLVITLTHIQEAIKLAFKIKQNQKAVTLGMGESDNKKQMVILLSALSKAKLYQLSRRELLKQHFCDFDSPTLETLVLTLEGAGLIKTTSILNETGYQLTDRALTEVLNFQIEQKKYATDKQEKTGAA